MISIEEITEVFAMLHDSFIEKIEMHDSKFRFTLGAEFLASKLNSNYSYFFIDFFNATTISYEDWSDENRKYKDLDTILLFGSELWFTKGECKDEGFICIHGHGGNSTDDTSCGGTISFRSDNYIIYKEDGSELSIDELKRAYQLYRKEME
jgi:hypothetical protein